MNALINGGSSRMVEQIGNRSLSSQCWNVRLGPIFLSGAACLLFLSLSLQPRAAAQRLRLTNSLSVDRTEEVVEIPLAQITLHFHFSLTQLQSLVATDAATNQRIASQLFSDKPGADPDTLLLLIKLPAKGVLNVKFSLDRTAPPQKTLVFGRAVPERKDDFADRKSVGQ